MGVQGGTENRQSHGSRADRPPRQAKQPPAPAEAVEKAKHCTDKRVPLIIMLMDEAGLRRTELARAHTRDVIDDLTGKSIVVHGKGGKDRVIPLSDQLG